MGKISAFYVMPHPPIIIPEIGKGEEQKINKTLKSCQQIAAEVAKIKPDTIVIVSPHGPVFSNAVAISYSKEIKGDLRNFGSQLSQSYKINSSLTKSILHKATENNTVCAVINEQTATSYNMQYQLDHGAMVPLYFINKQYSNYSLVHITYGMLPKLDLYKFGLSIKQAVEQSEGNIVFIASGDLSHKLANRGPYKYSKQGAIFDTKITELLQSGDVKAIFNMSDKLISEAGECGMRSFYIMLGAMSGNSITGNLLSYENTFGVGYGVLSFELTPHNYNVYENLLHEQNDLLNKRIAAEGVYVKLARESLKHYLTYGEKIKVPAYVTEEMLSKQNGVFVSLKKHGLLRGCIGTFMPTTDNIATEIINNGIQAGLHDPRFSQVTLDELPELTISVDVLTEPQPASIKELDPFKYGIIVSLNQKRGLLLPDLEGVDTVEKQLEIVLKKAGIKPHENYKIEKFEVIRHK